MIYDVSQSRCPIARVILKRMWFADLNLPLFAMQRETGQRSNPCFGHFCQRSSSRVLNGLPVAAPASSTRSKNKQQRVIGGSKVSACMGVSCTCLYADL